MKNLNTYPITPGFLKQASKSILAVLSCVMLTAGCASNMANFTGVESQNRNIVKMVRIPYNIRFGDGVVEMNNDETAKLNNFLMTTNVSYGDEFSMDFPLDRNGNLTDLDKGRVTYVSNLLKESGLYLSAKITPYGMEPSEGFGRLLISKYVVTPPNCGDWTQRPNPNYGNASISNIGCASQANLGLMVANPRDLIIGATGAPPNAERTAGAVQRYQTRTITVAPATTGSTSSTGN